MEKYNYLFSKGNGEIFDKYDLYIFMYVFLLYIINNGLGYLVKIFFSIVFMIWFGFF